MSRILSSLLLLLTCKSIELSFTEKPNVIVFVADDVGFGDVAYNGDPALLTPNIDALAADGIILNNFYATPVCTPSRGALLSGYLPIHSGTQNFVILTTEPRGFPLNQSLLPNYLKQYDYATHAVGKWHLGFYKKEYTPTFRGFDSHVGYWAGATGYYDHTTLETVYWGLDFRHNLDPITNATGIYSTDYYTQRCEDLIKTHNKSRPLFLYMAYQNCHGANHYARLQAPQELINKFPHIKDLRRRTFAAMVLAMDLSIGRIFKQLHENGLLNNSIVIFMSDNGGPAHGFTGNAASNWPLRGTKATLWEGGVRVPAFIWSPLLKKSGYVSNALMHITDWLPTIMDAIGDKSFAKEEIYGMSMWNTLSKDEPSPRKEILLNIDPVWNVSAIRVGKWKLVQGLIFPKWAGWYPPFGVASANEQEMKSEAESVLHSLNRRPNYENFSKLRVKCGKKPLNASKNCKPDIEPCLFNIELDPCEYNNVAHLYSKIVKKLWLKILAYNQTAVPPANQPVDKCASPVLHDYKWTNWRDDPSKCETNQITKL